MLSLKSARFFHLHFVDELYICSFILQKYDIYILDICDFKWLDVSWCFQLVY